MTNRKGTLFILIFLFISLATKAQNDNWQLVANGVWKYNVGTQNNVTLLNAAGVIPDLSKFNVDIPYNFPLNKEDIKITVKNNKIYLRFPLDKKEQIYGFGLQFKSVNRRGNIYNLHVDHYGDQDNGRTHAPVPFYISSNGYGVLINSARYITAYVGTTVRVDTKNPPVVYDRNTDNDWDAQPESDAVEILIPDDNAEIVVFKGDSPLDVVRKYNLYCGGGCLPPKWGLGVTYRTHTLFTADKVIALVDEFKKQGFPLSFVGLEPGWMSMSYPCSYEWDKGRFPEPEKFVKGLLDKGIRTNLWMNPYIAPKASLYKAMLPFAGSHTVWNGIIPDYTLAEPKKLFADFYLNTHLNIGVSGLKIDEVDGFDNWLWPDVATFPSGLDAEQMRQTYGLVMQNMVADIYHKNNVRTYGLVRASNAGASRLPFVIYDDYYKHEDYITALINSSFAGVLWTPEVRSSATGEEWLRRTQSVCFSPMAMIDAWSSGTMPWSYPEVYDAVKKVALLRMQLLPYIYSTFADYHFNGTPPIRPMQLVDGFLTEKKINNADNKEQIDKINAYNKAIKSDVKDQYMFGDNILVAPVFTGQKSRDVILPKGKWYNFYTGKFAGEQEIIHVDANLDEIPLYVKDGGIIPMIEPRTSTPIKGEKLALEVRHYGTANGKFQLYDDDGESYDYEKGIYSWTELSVEHSKGSVKRDKGSIFNYTNIKWEFMTQ